MPTTPGSKARPSVSVRPAATIPSPVHRAAPPVNLNQLLTVAQVAKTLQLDTRTIRRYVAARHLPAYRVGRALRVHPADVERFLAAQRVGA